MASATSEDGTPDEQTGMVPKWTHRWASTVEEQERSTSPLFPTFLLTGCPKIRPTLWLDPAAGTFPFLQIPRELRDKVYDYLLIVDPWTARVEGSRIDCPGLLRVNRQLHEEASTVFYDHNDWITVAATHAVNVRGFRGDGNSQKAGSRCNGRLRWDDERHAPLAILNMEYDHPGMSLQYFLVPLHDMPCLVRYLMKQAIIIGVTLDITAPESYHDKFQTVLAMMRYTIPASLLVASSNTSPLLQPVNHSVSYHLDLTLERTLNVASSNEQTEQYDFLIQQTEKLGHHQLAQCYKLDRYKYFDEMRKHDPRHFKSSNGIRNASIR